jgi:hypothetical protein
MRFVVFFLFVFSFLPASALSLKATHKLEVQLLNSTNEFLILEELRDKSGSVYFVSFRRGKQTFPPAMIFEKKYKLWHKQITQLSQKRTVASMCKNKLDVLETNFKTQTSSNICVNNLQKSKLVQNKLNPMVKFYRKSQGLGQ